MPVALLLLVLALAAVPGAAAGPGQVVVFDAGSSGTKVNVFSMELSRNPAVPDVHSATIAQECKKIVGGLAEFARDELNENGLRKNMGELLKCADRYVDEAARKTTPVLIKFTAGYRDVEKQNAANLGHLLDIVRSVLKVSDYKYDKSFVGPIDGKEEGGLAWVTANYLLGAFGDGRATTGVIDMGGGSTQVTFEVGPPVEVADDDLFTFTTASKRVFRLYAHSYMDYGQDYALKRLSERTRGLQTESPCHLTTEVEQSLHIKCDTHTRHHLFDNEVAPGRYGEQVNLKSGYYFATSAFFHVLHRHLEEKTAELEPATLSAKALQVCQDLKSDTNTKNDCFRLTYQSIVLESLVDDNKFGGKSNIHIYIKDKIERKDGKSYDLSWALGAALVHYLQADRDNAFVTVVKFMARNWWWLLSATVLVVLALVFACSKKGRPIAPEQNPERQGVDMVEMNLP